MKKVLALLLIVAFAGVAVVAQDEPAAPVVKFTGRVQTGFAITETLNQNTNVAAIVLKDSKDSGYTLDSRFGATFGDGKTYGLVAGFGFKNGANPAELAAAADIAKGIALKNLYATDTFGWVMPVSQVKMSVGKVTFGDYGENVNGNGNSQPSVTALKVDLMPFAGMETLQGITFGYYLPINANSAELASAFHQSVIGVKFSDAKLFTLSVDYFFTNKDTVDAWNGSFKDISNPGVDNGQLDAWFGLTAIENLTVEVGTTLIANSKGTILENFAYNLGVVKPQLYMTQTIGKFGAYTLDFKPQLSFFLVPGVFNPYVAYDFQIISQPGCDTGLWTATLRNDFAVGPGAIRVQYDLGSNPGNVLSWTLACSYNLAF